MSDRGAATNAVVCPDQRVIPEGQRSNEGYERVDYDKFAKSKVNVTTI